MCVPGGVELQEWCGHGAVQETGFRDRNIDKKSGHCFFLSKYHFGTMLALVNVAVSARRERHGTEL